MKGPGAKWAGGVGAHTPVEEAARRVLSRRLGDVARLLGRAARGGAGDGDDGATPESVRAVHALRVATRRACGALEAFGPLVAGKDARRLSRRLRKIRRTAGAVRDQDVHREMLEAALKAARDGAQRAALRAVLREGARRRGEARGPLVELASAWPAKALRAKLERAVGRVGEGKRAGAMGRGATLLDAARDVLGREVDRVRDAAGADLHDLERVHALRLELKRLRYAAEIFAPCLGRGWDERFGPALAGVQGALGEVNDAHVLLGTLRGHLESLGKPSKSGRKTAKKGARGGAGSARASRDAERVRHGLESLVEGLESRLRSAHGAFLEAWGGFASGEFFDALLGALAPAAPAAETRVEPAQGRRGRGAPAVVEVKPAGPGRGPLGAGTPNGTGHAPGENGTHAGSKGRAGRGRRRIAAIDVGTNSIRLIVAETQPDGSYRVLDDEKEVTRLGRGLAETGRMNPAAVAHSAATIARMRAIAEGYGAAEVRVVGTAAAREAANADLLRSLVRERTGLEMRVISGEEEAMLAYRSAARAFDLAAAPALVLDVGGGSTEMVLSAAAGPGDEERRAGLGGGVIERVYTLPLGAVRLTEMFGGPEACAGERFEDLRRHIKRALRDAVGTPPTVPQVVVGTGGTLTTLAAMAMIRELGAAADGLFGAGVQGHEVRRPDLKHLLDYLRKLPLKERARVPGLGADRADIIVAGLAIVDGVLKRFGANAVRVHEGGIRDGLLLSMAREGISPGAEGTAGGQAIDPMKGVRRFAKACGYEAAHARHVTGLALEIFDQLAEQMGGRGGAGKVPDGQAWPARPDFGAEARLLLEAASLLHDVGYLINYAQHHKHSFHLITHADLPGFTTRQVRVIANVARYHRAAEPKLKHRTFAALGEGDRALVRQLAGVLRVADGLDRTHMQSVAGVRVKVGKGVAAFEVRAEREPSVDMWGAVRKAGLFKDVFGVLPEFEWRAAGPSKVEVAGRPRGETVTA